MSRPRQKASSGGWSATKAPGVPDPVYVAARRVLLDALEALGPHRAALVLVGAQAVYVHTGEADLPIAPYTTDADIAIDPALLGSDPRIEHALQGAGFVPDPSAVGIWRTTVDVDGSPRPVEVDLLVPQAVGGSGRRAARIPPHSTRAARKVAGLEGTLVDNELRVIGALDAADRRQIEVAVAGPTGLIVAKVYKIRDREAEASRREDKDALDVYRLLRAVPTADLLERFERLRRDPRTAVVAAETVGQVERLFGSPRALGCAMAVRAAGPIEDGQILAASLSALADDLLRGLRR